MNRPIKVGTATAGADAVDVLRTELAVANARAEREHDARCRLERALDHRIAGLDGDAAVAAARVIVLAALPTDVDGWREVRRVIGAVVDRVDALDAVRLEQRAALAHLATHVLDRAEVQRIAQAAADGRPWRTA